MKNIKPVIITCLAFLLFVMPVNADDINSESVETIDSDYMVVVPKSVKISSETKSGSYRIRISGDIAEDEKITIVPDKNIVFTSTSKSVNKKPNVEGTITQNKVTWTAEDMEDAVGTIDVPSLSAGDWGGSFEFEVSIDKVAGDVEPVHTHTPGEPVHENEVQATYEEAGHYDEVIYCTSCGEELSRTAVTIPKLEITYIEKLFDNSDLQKLGYTSTWVSASNGGPGYILKDKNGNEVDALVIPKTLEYNETYYEFTGIADNACYRLLNVKTITLPENITIIGNSAFAQCKELISINIPNGVKSIGSQAFDQTKITSIVIPDTVETIHNNAFAVNTLTSVTMGSGVKTIENHAFTGAPIDSITLPNTLTSIGEGALAKTNITSITIPDNVEELPSYCLEGNKFLTSIAIGRGVKKIGVHALSGNESLTSITIPANVESMGTRSLAECKNLSTIVFEGKPVFDTYVIQSDPKLNSVTYDGVSYTNKTEFQTALKEDGQLYYNTQWY